MGSWTRASPCNDATPTGALFHFRAFAVVPWNGWVKEQNPAQRNEFSRHSPMKPSKRQANYSKFADSWNLVDLISRDDANRIKEICRDTNYRKASIIIKQYSQTILYSSRHIISHLIAMWLHKVDDQGKMVKNHSWQNKSKHYVSRCLLLLSKSLLQTQSSHWHSRCDHLSWSPWRANSKLNKSSVCPSCECFKDSQASQPPRWMLTCCIVTPNQAESSQPWGSEVDQKYQNTLWETTPDHSMIAEPDDPSCLDPGPRWQMVPGPKWRPWCHTKCHFIDCLPKCDYCILLWLRVKTWFCKKQTSRDLAKAPSAGALETSCKVD